MKNAKLFGILAATAAVIGNTYYNKRKTEPPAGDEETNDLDFAFTPLYESDGPIFEKDDRVIVVNPYTAQPTQDEIPTSYIVQDSAYNAASDVYMYKLDDGTTNWYNESWLDADVHGPLVLGHDLSPYQRQERIDQQLALLALYGAVPGVANEAAVREIKARLVALTRKDDAE